MGNRAQDEIQARAEMREQLDEAIKIGYAVGRRANATYKIGMTIGSVLAGEMVEADVKLGFDKEAVELMAEITMKAAAALGQNVLASPKYPTAPNGVVDLNAGYDLNIVRVEEVPN